MAPEGGSFVGILYSRQRTKFHRDNDLRDLALELCRVGRPQSTQLERLRLNARAGSSDNGRSGKIPSMGSLRHHLAADPGTLRQSHTLQKSSRLEVVIGTIVLLVRLDFSIFPAQEP